MQAADHSRRIDFEIFLEAAGLVFFLLCRCRQYMYIHFVSAPLPPFTVRVPARIIEQN